MTMLIFGDVAAKFTDTKTINVGALGRAGQLEDSFEQGGGGWGGDIGLI